MIRTADAAGIDAVIVGHGSVDILTRKYFVPPREVIFIFQLYTETFRNGWKQLKEKNIPVYGTALENANTYTDTMPPRTVCFNCGE